MILDRVKLNDIDQSISDMGGRRLEIRISSSKSFATPVRPITTGELSAKSFLGYKGKLVAPIAALPMSIEGKTYQKFLQNNGTVNRLRAELEMQVIAASPLVKFPIFQTPSISTEDKLPLKISFDMQSMMPSLDYISIPDLKCNGETYGKVVEDWCESAMDEFGKGCVPQLSMNDDSMVFGQKLDVLSTLSKSGLISIVNLVYSNPKTHSIHYAKLWDKRGDLEFLINCSEVPQAGSELIPGMTVDLENTLTMYGIDSISRRKNRLSQKAVAFFRSQSPPKSIDETAKFNWAIHHASAMVNTNHWTKVQNMEPCNCSVCRGRDCENLIDEFAYSDNGDIEKMGLKYMSKLHDHQSDQIELSEVGKAIREKDMNGYQRRASEKRENISKVIIGV